MKRFVFHLICFIVSVISIGAYINFRLSDEFDSSKISRLDGMITHVVGGMILLVLIIIVLKPSVNICQHIAEIPDTEGKPKHLRFKIVNTSLFRAYDMEIRIFHKQRTNMSGADITSTLIASFEGYQVGISYLESSLSSVFEDTKTNAAQFRIFKIVNDDVSDAKIRQILNSNDSYLEIHVYLRSGLSGLQGNFIKKFHNTSCIKSGFYKHGFSTEIAV